MQEESKPKSNKIDSKELLVKYKELAEEYKKVVKESQILKKAILQEHEKSSNVSTITREKDQKVQALEEENVVLKYNNDRLTKRLMVLQESVNNQKKQESKVWFSWGSSEDSNKQKEEIKLFMEELERKTMENEMLHNEVSLVKQEQQQVVELLQSKIVLLKSNIESEKEEYLKKDSEQQEILLAIKKEKDVFTAEISDLTIKLAKLQEEINNKTNQLHENEIKSTQNIVAYTNIIQRQISFDDSNNTTFNSFNIPTFNKNIEGLQQKLISEANTLFIEVGNAFINEYEAYQERILYLSKAKELTPQLVQSLKKVGEYLSLFSKQLIPLFEALQNRFGPSGFETSNKSVFESATNFIVYHQKLISWMQLSIKEESLQEDSDPSTHSINESLNELYGEVHESIYRLLSCFYSPPSKNNNNENSEKTNMSVKEIIHSLKEGIIQIVGCRKGISLLIHSKLLTEYNDAFLLPRLRAANEKYELCLEQTNQLIMNMQLLFEKYYEQIIIIPTSAPVRGVKPNLQLNNQNSNNDILKRSSLAIQKVNSLSQLSLPQYVPFNIHNEQEQQLEQMKAENITIKEKLETLTKDNESIKLEKLKALTDVNKYKEDNTFKQSRINSLLTELVEKRKVIETMGNNHNIINSNASNETDNNTNKNSNPESTSTDEGKNNSEDKFIQEGHDWELTVIDPNGATSHSLPICDEFQEKELKLEKYYTEKLSSFNNILKLSDSRVVEMFQYQEKLEKQISQLKSEKEELNKNLQSAFMQHSMSVDHHDTTKENYDQQLNVLSEHVVQLTQKIATTEEELDTIKAYKVRCGRCKTWNSIEWLLTEGKNGQYCSRGAHPSSFNFA